MVYGYPDSTLDVVPSSISVGGGFAGMGIMVYLFVALFIIGSFILIMGLFTKIDIEQASPK